MSVNFKIIPKNLFTIDITNQPILFFFNKNYTIAANWRQQCYVFKKPESVKVQTLKSDIVSERYSVNAALSKSLFRLSVHVCFYNAFELWVKGWIFAEFIYATW